MSNLTTHWALQVTQTILLGAAGAMLWWGFCEVNSLKDRAMRVETTISLRDEQVQRDIAEIKADVKDIKRALSGKQVAMGGQ